MNDRITSAERASLQTLIRQREKVAKADVAGRTLADAVNVMRFDEIARLAELSASYWRGVGLAADRGEVITIITRCRQAAADEINARKRGRS
jgi:hypothetical protein